MEAATSDGLALKEDRDPGSLDNLAGPSVTCLMCVLERSSGGRYKLLGCIGDDWR